MFESKKMVEESSDMMMVEKPKSKKMISIMPLKDFHISHNGVDIVIKEGERIEVPKLYIQNLKTEKVIKE